MDKLSQLIEEKVNIGDWIPMKAGRQGPHISHLLFADDLVLFMEASPEQMRIAMESLEEFKKASSFKVNPMKTSIYFSKNVDVRTRQEIVRLSGFSDVESLGRYLGAIFNNKRKGKNKFKKIIDRVAGKLKGWKAKCLSLGGRITLVQSAISPSINFDMMYTSIPKGVCLEIEKMQRRFIWGEETNKRRIHNVNWEVLCKPKINGRMRLEAMNEAFLVKLLWRLLKNEKVLWSEVLRRSPPFNPMQVDLSLTVRDAITAAAEWNVTYLQNFLTEDILSTIRAMPPAMDSMGQDMLTWELTNDGEFSVSSTYSALTQHEEEQNQVWTLI
ncbi:hypothetical protein AHAS_Ahas17G0101800 [Arachis hypogaea]